MTPVFIAVIGATVISACAGGTIDRATTPSSTSGTTGATTSTPDSSSTTTESTTTTEAPTTTESDAGTIDSPLPVGAADGFTYSDFGGEWDGTVLGLVETGLGDFNDGKGRCLVLVGTLTPTSIEDGAVTNPFNTPGVSLIADGGLVDSGVGDCDVVEIEAAGYGWILDAEVTVGTTYPFYAEFFLSGASPAEPEVIVVGSASGAEALYYEPTILDTIPSP